MKNLLYRLRYHYGRQFKVKTPVDISLELASICNLRCSYCYHADQENLPFTKGVMTYETASRIIQQACLLNVPALKFNWKGEGTLNPDYYQILSLAASLANGYTFQDRIVNSNFQFNPKKEEIFEAMCKATKVKISYDSFHKDVFESQRKGASHEVVTSNIDRLYHWPDRDNEMIIQAVRTKNNYTEDIEGNVRKYWPKAKVSIRDVVDGRVDNNHDLSVKKRQFEHRQPCKQAYVRLIFNHKGDAFPCCPDVKEQLRLGNIHSETMEDIFNGYLAKMLRKSLKDGSAFLEDPCKTCSSFESFKGTKGVWQS